MLKEEHRAERGTQGPRVWGELELEARGCLGRPHLSLEMSLKDEKCLVGSPFWTVGLLGPHLASRRQDLALTGPSSF